MKKRNQLLKEKENKLNNSFTKKKKTIKPKIVNIGKDIDKENIDKTDIEIRIEENKNMAKEKETEIRVPTMTPSKRKTMKPKVNNPYATNY